MMSNVYRLSFVFLFDYYFIFPLCNLEAFFTFLRKDKDLKFCSFNNYFCNNCFQRLKCLVEKSVQIYLLKKKKKRQIKINDFFSFTFEKF